MQETDNHHPEDPNENKTIITLPGLVGLVTLPAHLDLKPGETLEIQGTTPDGEKVTSKTKINPGNDIPRNPRETPSK